MPISHLRVTTKIDTKLIVRNWRKINKTPLYRSAAMVRKEAVASLKITKKGIHSKPGNPPFVRSTGSPLRKMFITLDLKTGIASVGPKAFRKRNAVPTLLERGGTVKRKVFVKRQRSKIWSALFGKKARRVQKFQKVLYKPRPYMRPALARVLNRIPREWQDALKRATPK
jgi:hypothetical protein